ncbi:hypothetical protein ACP4OV_026137 [Aristida adscensionis]
MGLHLLAIAAAARGFLQLFNVSAPLLWPLNLCLPRARHLPEACAALRGLLAAHAAWLRAAAAYARGAVWSRGGSPGGVDAEHLRRALLTIPD